MLHRCHPSRVMCCSPQPCSHSQAWVVHSPASPALLPPACPLQDLLARTLFPPGLGPLSAVPRSGPAPVVMRVEDWIRVAPRWESIADQVRGSGGALGCIGVPRWVFMAWCIQTLQSRLTGALTACLEGMCAVLVNCVNNGLAQTHAEAAHHVLIRCRWKRSRRL